MSISDTGEVWGLLIQAPRREAADTKRQESALTLSRYIVESSQRTLRISMLLLLTSAAGWTDVLRYLAVGRVFASLVSGNMLFVGISIAQGNMALLVRAVVAILLLFVGITLGSLYLQRLPARQTLEGWLRTLVRYLESKGSSCSPSRSSGRSSGILPNVQMRRWYCWASPPSPWGCKARWLGHSTFPLSSRSP